MSEDKKCFVKSGSRIFYPEDLSEDKNISVDVINTVVNMNMELVDRLLSLANLIASSNENKRGCGVTDFQMYQEVKDMIMEEIFCKHIQGDNK